MQPTSACQFMYSQAVSPWTLSCLPVYLHLACPSIWKLGLTCNAAAMPSTLALLLKLSLPGCTSSSLSSATVQAAHVSRFLRYKAIAIIRCDFPAVAHHNQKLLASILTCYGLHSLVDQVWWVCITVMMGCSPRVAVLWQNALQACLC